jgi:hypothetical protein
MAKVSLPGWPTKGSRRKLDLLWLKELETRGVSAFFFETPEAPPQLYQAMEEFNDGRFWECHETLEEVWLNTPYPLRLFYHALIKLAAGFHHLSHHNRYGARSKLAEGIRLLRPFSPCFQGIRTGPLCRDAGQLIRQLEGDGSLDWTRLEGGYPSVSLVGRPRRPQAI